MKFKNPFVLILFIYSTLVFGQSPNVVVIIADDMGWNQVSTPLTNLNNPSDFYETPTLETLASQGIAFTNAYVNGANCAPTRAAILSGQYASRPHNNIFNVNDLNRGNTSSNSILIGPDMGLASNGNIDEIPSSAITIAETMKTAGYVTGHWGKYHVGENEASNVSNNAATDQGFDYNYGGGTDGGPGNYFASSTAPYMFGDNIGPELDQFADPYTEAESQLLAGNSTLTGTTKHITDAMADAAIQFLDAEKDTKFFMHFSNYAIHGPFGESHARPDLLAKYQAKSVSNPSSMDHDSEIGQAAIAEGMDQTISRIIDYLKTTPDPRNPGFMLSENTLVYFISDNGDAIKRTPQAPLKGMKGEYYEGGIRSVTIAWSEAQWLANKGTVNHTPIIAFDLYPTLAEIAGAVLPGGGYDIDGESQWQMLTNGTSMSREAIYWHFPGYLIDSKRDSRPTSIIRKGDYKLRYNYESLSYELFDVVNDIGEDSNLLDGSPNLATLTLANNMSTLLRNHLINISAPLPTYRSDGTTVPLPYIISGGSNSIDGCQAVGDYEAYWDFDTSNSQIGQDISGNSHNPITITGALSGDSIDFKEGDQSAYFNGSTKVEYTDTPFLRASTNSRSISVWLKPTALSGIQNIFDEGGGTKGFAVRLNESNLELIVRASSSISEQISSPFPNDGEWHHLAFVYDGTNTTLNLYIDGAEVATSSNVPVSIGNHNGSGIGGKIGGADSFGNTNENYFNGKMDAFAVYDGVISVADVEAGACYSQVTADAGPDVTICDGDSTTLAATGGDTYLWSTGATTASINVSPSSTATYTVTVFVGGSSDNDDVIVTVNPLPIADAGADVTICDGDSTTLTAAGGDSYLWSTGETTASINVSPNSTTIYSVTATQNGCLDDDDVTITVYPLPNANAGGDVTICNGESTLLTATGGDTYLWSTGATTASINVNPNSSTVYTVTATQNGCSDTDDVSVNVNPAPNANAGLDVTICEGDSTTLTATGGDTYLWSTGATTASIIVSPNVSSTYTVSTLFNGCVVSDNDDVNVMVNALPIANAGPDVSICEGDSTMLTATGGGSYLWSTGATTASINVSPSSTTIYTVTVTSNGCSDNDSVMVNVNSLPTVDAGNDIAICQGDSTTLTATGGDTYLWSTGATTSSINVSPSLSTIYTVTATTNGCSANDDVFVTVNSAPTANAGPDVTICDGDSTELIASGGDTYLWSTGDTTATIIVSPNSSTTYTVIVSNSGCGVIDNDDVIVSVNPLPSVDIGADVSICEGDSTTLTATGGGTYLWSTGDTAASINVSPGITTVYAVTATTNGCSVNDSLTVTVNPAVVAEAGTDVSICEGDSTTLTATGGDTYLWSTGATTASINVSPSSTTFYTVTVTSDGCSDNDSVKVTVNPDVVAEAGADVIICLGDSATLSASGGDTYLWSTGDTAESINVSPNSTTVYSVTVTLNGCSDSDSVLVNVNSLPNADAGADVTIDEGDSTMLTATGGDSYLWSTGANTASITVSPNVTSVYAVTVTSNGCSDNDDVVVTVDNVESDCEVPNSYEAYWNFDMINGANDASDNNHNPTAINGTLSYDTLDYKQGNQSVVFDGDVDIEYSTSSFLTVPFTVKSFIAWIKPTALTGIQEILDEGGGSKGIALRLNAGTIEAIVRGGNSSATELSATYPNDGEWHHVALVYDGGNTSFKLYIDGVEVDANYSAVSYVGNHGGAGGIGGIIGNKDSFKATSDYYFTGNLDAIAVYDGVLSLTEIEAAACAGNTGGQRESSVITQYNNLIINSSKLYPNPFTDQINIKIDGEFEEVKVEVHNVIGQTLFFKEFKYDETIKIPTTKFERGQYLIRIKVDDQLINKKAVKR